MHHPFKHVKIIAMMRMSQFCETSVIFSLRLYTFIIDIQIIYCVLQKYKILIKDYGCIYSNKKNK